MRSQQSSPLALEARAQVTKQLHLLEGAGEAVDDVVYIRIALAAMPESSSSSQSPLGAAVGHF